MSVTAPIPEASPHECLFDGQPWHDRLLTLENDLGIALEIVEGVCRDYVVEFIEPEQLLLFVSLHDWRDRVTVTKFANQIAGLAEYVETLRRKTGFYDKAEAASI